MNRSTRLRNLTHLSFVTAGVALLGIGSYALLLAVNRSAPAADVAAFGSFWALSFGLVAGVLLPFEQLMVRATAGAEVGAAAVGRKQVSPDLPAARVLQLYVAVSLILALGLLLGSGPLGEHLLGGDRRLAWVLAAYVVVAFGQSWQRGRAAGAGRLDRYGYQLAADGGLRLCIGAGLLLTGGGDAFSAAVGLLAAGFASLAVAPLPRLSVWPAGGRMSVVAREALLMSSATTVSLWLLNAGPVVVVSAGATHAAAAAFASLFVITRIPLLFQGSLQSVVLATVVGHVERADAAALRRSVFSTVGIVALAGIGTVVLFGILADVWAGLLYDSRFSLGVAAGSGLALSTALFLVGAVGHVVLVGLNAARQASVAWAVSTAAFGLVVVIVQKGPVERVVWAYVVAGCVLLVVQALYLGPRMRLPPTSDSAWT